MLTDLCDVSEIIQQRLLNTQRIKVRLPEVDLGRSKLIFFWLFQYTCFSASEKYLVFGATSGSLYLFQRSPCKFRYLIPNRTSSVSLVAISCSERYIAHATGTGEIFLSVLDSETGSPERAVKLETGRITCLHWAAGDKCLYFGDDCGRVACVSISTFIHRSLLNMHTQEVLLLASPVLQIDSFDVLLLITTTSGSLMCNTEREEFKRIGSQARNGAGGACFVGVQKDEYLSGRIFCARPKTRFWEVQFDGNVKQTIDLKEALAIPPTRIRQSSPEGLPEAFPAQILNFHQLQCMENKLIVANTSSAIYIFDPSQSFVLWNDEFSNIHSVRIVGNALYIFLTTMEVFVVCVTKLCDHIVDTLTAENFHKCLELINMNNSYVKNHVRLRENVPQVGKFRKFLRDTNQDDALNILETIISTPKPQAGGDIPIPEEAKFPQKNIKDVIATVIKSKLGKNIKLGLNLLASFDTAPKQEQPQGQNGHRMVFREIEEFSANSLSADEEIVTRKMVLSKKTSPEMVYPRLTDEEKLLRNLYMIYKSSRIGNIRLVERYAEIFDRYTLAEISALLGKLQGVMVENGEFSF